MKDWRSLAEFFGPRRNLVILLIAIFAIGAGDELWMRFIPKYLQALGATVLIIGTFDAIRTLLGAIYAYPGGLVVDRWGFRHAFLSGSFAMLALAFAIRGLKEFGDTSRKALIIGYSDPQRRGQAIGTYYLVRDLLVSTGAL